ncbi:ATP-binding cassette domain-containing protein [Candidatus Foliamicus sp.]
MSSDQSSIPLIALQGVGRVFETDAGALPVLEGVSISIHAGEFVCITGPSGSGKSTLLNILGCLDRPTEGACRIAGRETRVLDDAALALLRRETFGFVFQDYGLLDLMTAQRNVELPAVYAGIGREERSAQAQDFLRLFGLERRMTHFPAELSGGERQRVAVARAVMNGRQAILADEPTGALDSKQGEEILSLLRQLASHGYAVVVASHDKAVAAAAGRQIELRDGVIERDSGRVSNAAGQSARLAVGRAPRARLSSLAAGALREGFGSLFAARLRTGLLLAVSMLGVSSTIALLGLADGAHRASLQVMGNLGADRISMGQVPTPGMAQFDEQEAQAIEQLPNVHRAVLSQSLGERVVRRGEKIVGNVQVMAIEQPEEFMWMQWPLASGGYITKLDSTERRQVAVLGPRLRDFLFLPGQDPLGEWVEVAGVPLQVKGVLDWHPIMEGENYRERSFPPTLSVPFATARDFIPSNETSPGISAYVKDLERLEETKASIRDLLIQRLGHEDFVIGAIQNILGPYRAGVKLRIRVLAGIAVGALLAGGMVTTMLMLGAVRQRRREIAIRMAVGGRKADILWQFITEAGAISLAGTAVGVPLGFLAGYAIELVVGAPTAWQPWFTWAAASAALVSGLAAGVVPAYRASRLDPAAALAA